jgi:error-prone DNA polymerase
MYDLFHDYPEAIANTKLLADRCQFELKYGLQDLPQLTTPKGISSSAYLRRLCHEALPERYPYSKGQDNQNAARQQLAHELKVIEQAGLANYFLIVWDIVCFSREEGIRCQGRGSAANSLVAYLLYISPIDPLAHDLVFERFLSSERQVVPDIDIDFDAQRREEVIQYVYTKYGADHTAMACTFVTFRSRSAIRDISKVLDMPPEIVAAATETLDATNNNQQSTTNEQQESKSNGFHSSSLHLLLDLVQDIEGFPRHLGIHSGGMIITGSPLMGRVPTEPATMPDRWVVQWDKDGLEDTGLVKIDILGLRMLSAITECVALIEESSGINSDLDSGLARHKCRSHAGLAWHKCRSHALSFTDPAVYEMIGQADTIGAFQVESRAQAQMLPKLKPKNFNDLVVAISLIRPGPIQGNMVHPFLRRRQGLEPVTYTHPALEPALAETLGVILFQEQVLKIARDLAGFTAGQGEQLRRALGSKRATEAIERFHTAFLEGAQAQAVSAEVAEKVFDQLRAFGGYSFAKSHAAAFAVLVYQSAWLKRHHFALFTIALLNNQPMGFWTPAVLVNEAKRKGIQVLPVDLYQSQTICTPVAGGNEDGIRLGFNYVKSLPEEHIERILAERKSTPFNGLADFYHRVRPGRRATENLIMTGAMDSWGLPRRQLLWELGTLYDSEGELDLIFSTEEVTLPTLSPAEAMLGEQQVLGLSTGEQIMAFYRTWLADRDILDSQQLTLCANGQRVCVAGLVVIHQAPPTAKGFHFITLEDESGMLNIIVRPQVYDQYRSILHGSRLLLVEGMVQQEDSVISILARRAAALSVIS